MRIDLDPAAVRDFKRLPKAHQPKVRRTLEALDTAPYKAIKGCPPWQRARSGQTRILYRAIDDALLVARIVQRKDLERAVGSL